MAIATGESSLQWAGGEPHAGDGPRGRLGAIGDRLSRTTKNSRQRLQFASMPLILVRRELVQVQSVVWGMLATLPASAGWLQEEIAGGELGVLTPQASRRG